MRPLRPRATKQRASITAVDIRYMELLKTGITEKDAAKQAQAETGLSKVTGLPMKTRGYGWQKR